MMKQVKMLLFVALLSAAAVSAADQVLPNVMAKANIGDWVVLRDVSGADAGELTRIRVVDRSGSGKDETIILRREGLGEDGEATSMRDIVVPLARIGERLRTFEERAKQISRERLTVKGEEITAYAVTWDHENDDGEALEFKIWLSEQIPVGGMIKIWSSDPTFSAMEIDDYGFAD